MKKFKFSLETVLAYKQQVLEALQTEHAAIIAEVHDQEILLETLWKGYEAYSAEYRERCTEGISVTDALACQAKLRAREREIKEETEHLEQLRRKEEAKRMEVVEAKQETSSIEKLREKKLNTYNAAIAKSEEQFIEEFVSSRRSVAAGM